MENTGSVSVSNGVHPVALNAESGQAPTVSTASNVPEPSAAGAIPVATTAEQQGISAGKEHAHLTC